VRRRRVVVMLGFVVVGEFAVGNNTTIDVRSAFLQRTGE
jgi:hypothetical protein